MEEAKGMGSSRTLKFNAVLGALATAATQVPEFAALFGPQALMWLMFASTVGNMYLRMKTKQPIDPNL